MLVSNRRSAFILSFQIINNLETLFPVDHELLVLFILRAIVWGLYFNNLAILCLHLLSVDFEAFLMGSFSDHLVWDVTFHLKGTLSFQEFRAFIVFNWLCEGETWHDLISLLFLLLWLPSKEVHVLRHCSNLIHVEIIHGVIVFPFAFLIRRIQTNLVHLLNKFVKPRWWHFFLNRLLSSYFKLIIGFLCLWLPVL